MHDATWLADGAVLVCCDERGLFTVEGLTGTPRRLPASGGRRPIPSSSIRSVPNGSSCRASTVIFPARPPGKVANRVLVPCRT